MRWTYTMKGCDTSHGLPIIVAGNGHLVASLASRNEDHAKLLSAAPRMAEFVNTLANMQKYTWPADGSWTDDQAEDALVTLNRLIATARLVQRRLPR